MLESFFRELPDDVLGFTAGHFNRLLQNRECRINPQETPNEIFKELLDQVNIVTPKKQEEKKEENENENKSKEVSIVPDNLSASGSGKSLKH